MPLSTVGLLFSCEHAGNDVPKSYSGLFQKSMKLLESHRGYDLGAYPIAKKLADYFKAPLVATKTTRLLIDCNRSLNRPTLFSEITEGLSRKEKKTIIEKYYTPYREKVKMRAAKYIDSDKSVLHLSIHSFTPVLHGIERGADIGLLYDPKRKKEKQFCKILKECLASSNFTVRLNYPYKGASDGLTTTLRKKLGADYLGIEIEVNQKYARNLRPIMKVLLPAIAQAKEIYSDEVTHAG